MTVSPASRLVLFLVVALCAVAVLATGPAGRAHAGVPAPPAAGGTGGQRPADDLSSNGDEDYDEAGEDAGGPEDALAPIPDAVPVDDGAWATSSDGREITLRVRVDGSQDYEALAKRFCGDKTPAAALSAANAAAPAAPGSTITVPWGLIRPEYRYLALTALFPADLAREDGYDHRPAAARVPNHAQGLWQVAEWFAGDGGKWPEIAKANGLTGPSLPAGRTIRVPNRLLLPLFRRVASGAAGLRYVDRAEGRFAEYRIARGEALYSAVVVRFTEFTRPGDVNAAAEVVRAASGIADVRRMEVGQRVLVPLDMLSPRYLPANHPRAIVQRLRQAELAGLAPAADAPALEGVHVLVDPGHGGDDVGAKAGRIWESDYVYDVACRLQRALDRKTSATVHMLVRDTQHGCRVFDRRALPRNKREVIDTTPPLPIRRGSTDIAVNLRWYLANDIYRRLRAAGVRDDRIVFLSLHADSLHVSLSGGMVYIPGERYRKASQGETGGAYRRFAEFRSAPRILLTRQDRLRDEAASRRLAEALIAGYRSEKLPVHEDQPVRDRIVRGRARTWVPAVLRANLVPAKVLVETVNINNKSDAALLEDPAGRERIARALAAGLQYYFDPRLDEGLVAGRIEASSAR